MVVTWYITAMEPVASAVSPLVQAEMKNQDSHRLYKTFDSNFQWFKERNPLTWEAVEWVANISQLVPVPLAKPLANVAKQGGKAIVKTAEGGRTESSSAMSKKITPTLPKAEELLVAQLEKTNRMNPTKYMELNKLRDRELENFLLIEK